MREVLTEVDGSRNRAGVVEVEVGRHDGRKKKVSTRGRVTRRSRLRRAGDGAVLGGGIVLVGLEGVCGWRAERLIEGPWATFDML